MRTRRFAFTPCLDVLSSRIAPSTVALAAPGLGPAPATFSTPAPSVPSQAGDSDDSSDGTPGAMNPTPDDSDYDPDCDVLPCSAYDY